MADDSAEFEAMKTTDVLSSTEVATSMTSTANLPTDLITDVATSALYDADSETVSLTRQCPKCGLMFSSEYDHCPVDGEALQGISAGLGGSLGGEQSDARDTDKVSGFDVTDVQRIKEDELLGVADDATLRGAVLEGRFYVEELIGEGGMGRVYRGSQLSVGRPVAIKVLHQRISQEPSIRERFNREARLVSGFSHPNTVRLIDFGDAEGHLYMVMELVDGVSLQQFAGRAPMNVAFSLEVIRQVCGPLAEAHKSDIVHRDLKPENIFVTRTADGRLQVKLLDFGVAHIDPATAEEQADTYRELTRQGVVVGTPEYMAPEQARGEMVTTATDIYALGVILYQLLSGRLPFYGQTPMHTMFQLVTKPVPPITDHIPNCPIPLVELLELLLQKAPERRIEDVVDAARRIRDVQRRLKIQPMTELPDGNLRAVLDGIVFEETAASATDEYEPGHRFAQDTEKNETPPHHSDSQPAPPHHRPLPTSRPVSTPPLDDDSDAFDEDAPTSVVNPAEAKRVLGPVRESSAESLARSSSDASSASAASETQQSEERPRSAEQQIYRPPSGEQPHERSSPQDPPTPRHRAPSSPGPEPNATPSSEVPKMRAKASVEPTAEIGQSTRPPGNQAPVKPVANKGLRAQSRNDPTKMRPYVPPSVETHIEEKSPRNVVLLALGIVVVLVLAAGLMLTLLKPGTPPVEAPIDPPELPRAVTNPDPPTPTNPPVTHPPVTNPRVVPADGVADAGGSKIEVDAASD